MLGRRATLLYLAAVVATGDALAYVNEVVCTTNGEITQGCTSNTATQPVLCGFSWQAYIQPQIEVYDAQTGFPIAQWDTNANVIFPGQGIPFSVNGGGVSRLDIYCSAAGNFTMSIYCADAGSGGC